MFQVGQNHLAFGRAAGLSCRSCRLACKALQGCADLIVQKRDAQNVGCDRLQEVTIGRRGDHALQDLGRPAAVVRIRQGAPLRPSGRRR